MELESEKIVLPSGKEVKLLDALAFCYDISDTDYKVLKAVLERKVTTEDELVTTLKLSKASVNRSLNKLISLGFIVREKMQSSKGGRPKYVYKALDTKTLIGHIKEDFKRCSQMFIDILPKVLLSSLGS